MRLANPRRRRLAAPALALLLLLLPAAGLLPAGCGGGTDSAPADAPSAGAGRAVFSVRWPERDDPSRLVPVAAESIRIVLQRGGAVIAERLIARPVGGGVSGGVFEHLPLGELSATASALPNADGSGIAQAIVTVPLTVGPGENTPLRLTMRSTIARLDVVPPTADLKVGQTRQLAATARDADDNIVLISPGAVTWASADPAVATVSPTGLIQAVATGEVTIEAREAESGAVGTARVGVTTADTGELLVYDGFDYPVGSGLKGKVGGTGWANGWNEYGQGYTPSAVVTGSLTFGDLKTSGNAVQTTSQRPVGHARVPAQQLGVDGTVLYASVLMRPLDPMNAGSPYTYYSLTFNDMQVGKSERGSDYSLDRRDSAFVGTGIPAVPGTTVFLVCRMTFRAGADRVEMWVNPAPGQPLPAPQAVKEDIDISLPGDCNFGTSIRVVVDEYRVGTSWESVSPTF